MKKLVVAVLLATLTISCREKHEIDIVIEPRRGDILSADGKVLATSIGFLEEAYSIYLTGECGIRTFKRLKSGELVPARKKRWIEPKDGSDVVTTIDIAVQMITDSCLRRRLQYHNADHGTAVVMEVSTGDIKAIANLGRDEFGHYKELYNYALGESKEPGSTFMLMTYMAMMEDGKLQLTDSIDNGTTGAVYYQGKRVHDDNRSITTGWITVEKAFAHSSNISVTKFADKHYRGKEKQFIDRIYGMNLNQKLGLYGEGDPDIKYPGNRYWTELTLTQMAYGYDVRLAPIHVLTFYNAVANDGKMVNPEFVKELTRQGATEKTFEVQVIKPQIASAGTISKAKKMLEAVVEYGTAQNIKTDIYKIAGKTGTVQFDNGNGPKCDASFVGYFPSEQPKYSIYVSIYDPTVNGYSGGSVAAPVFREIADEIFNQQ